MTDESGTALHPKRPGPAGNGPEPALAEGSVTEPEARGGGSLAAGLLRAARPKQWFKNVLVLAAPGAAGMLFVGAVPKQVGLAFLALCLVASGTYLVNDVADAEADRRHPRKRHRPIASGEVPAPVALAAGVALMLGGFATAYAVGVGLFGLVALYVALTSAYSIWLKHLAVLDIAAVASFFIIRAVAGSVATDIDPSRWFLIVASFGSLFVVAGKRYGESLDLGEARGAVRATLDEYSPEFLRYVWTLASGVTLTAYCLWAFEQSPTPASFPFFELSIIPFVLFILRYALLVEAGRASAPEDLILGDRALMLVGVAWIAVFGCGVYVGGG